MRARDARTEKDILEERQAEAQRELQPVKESPLEQFKRVINKERQKRKPLHTDPQPPVPIHHLTEGTECNILQKQGHWRLEMREDRCLEQS